MNYLSSNFNLLATNSYWEKLKKNHTLIDKNYNGIFLSLNKKNLETFSFFHFIYYVESLNFNQIIKELKNLNQIIKKHKKKKFFLYFFVNFYENPIQEKLFNDEFLKIKFDLNNLYIKNFHRLNKKLFSERNKVFIRFPFELKFINFISNEIKKNIAFFESKSYKLIILDCDNTLWKGVLDEDGYQNIKYDGDGEGQIFYQFQLFLKKKKKEGFVLSLSSKNNESNVWEAMKKRAMILQKKDFINPKINWFDKAVNIKQIINQLTLRSKDCVFIDDNPLEIEKVKSQIKDINTINVNNSLEILKKINKDSRLFKHQILKEDLDKYKQYKLKSKFENIFEKNTHSFDFYKKLNQKVRFETIQEKNFDRALQLFNKTNQFNFNLNRYTDISLKKMINSQMYIIKLISFKDKFGDHGIVGAYILKKKKLSIEIIDFVLSCRVLNRYLEDFIIIKIIKDYFNKDLTIFFKKEQVNNQLIPDFLKKNYFKFKKKNKNIYKYSLILSDNYHEIEKIFR